MQIEFDEVNDRYISVTYLEKDSPKELDVFAAGSGFQQFVYLFGFIVLRQPTVILLDEPDVHLHGTLQRALLEELRKLVADGKQILLATHSRELISQMSPENILVLEEKEAKRLSIAFDVYDTLDRLGSIDLSQITVIQAYQRVLIVEDRSDWDLLSVFCSKILGTSIWQQVERRLAICYAKGNPYKQDVARLRLQLQQMITIKGQLLKMFVVADRDYHPDLPFLYKDVPSEHIEWHIWERAEIENYLLSLNGIKRVLGEPQDQITLEEAGLATEFERLLEASYDSVNDKLVKAFQEYGRSRREQWDVPTLSKKAREYLQQHWKDEKLALTDAKEIVLPGIKDWLKSQNRGQFSNKSLARVLQLDDFPQEVHELARSLAKFASVEFE